MVNAQPVSNLNSMPVRRRNIGFFKYIFKNWVLFVMMLPLLVAMFFNNYLPMAGSLLAFKDYKAYSNSFVHNYIVSKWVGLQNFEFLWKTTDAFEFTRNTIVYNLVFIFLGLIVSVAVAIALNEVRNAKLSRAYQTIMFLPYFLSWVIVSYLVFAFLSEDMGFMNKVLLPALGINYDPSSGCSDVAWYSKAEYWPFILTFCQLWKYTGYNSVVYLAAIAGIDTEFYEAARIDGASKWQQIRKITLPMLYPLMTIMTLLAVGKIFNSDFGLFFQVPRNSGILYSTTRTIDTYVYTALTSMGDMGMAAATSFYQSVVGFVCVMASNLFVRKIDPEKALF